MNEKKELPDTYVLTGEVRLAFPWLFKMRPRARGSDKLAYQATLLLPPETDLTPYNRAMKAAIVAKWDKLIKLDPSKNPIKDAATKAYDGFAEGWHYIMLNNPFRQPPVVDALNRPVTDESKVYPGMWVRALIAAYAWAHESGGRGCSFSIEAVQLVRDDDRLDVRVDTFGVFDPIGDVSTDATGNDEDSPF